MRQLELNVDETIGRRAGLERALREAVRAGRLAAGSALPSSRILADDLGYSRATIVAVYEQLSAEGYLAAHQGKGTVVADVHVPRAQASSTPPILRGHRSDVRPGDPDASSFPRQAWLKSLRQVFATTPDAALGYPDLRGMPELRVALADYLARARAVDVAADSVSVFGGFSAAISFLAEMFVGRGMTDMAIEDPSLFIARDLVQLGGMQPVPIPVDDEGIDVDALEASGARVVLVTPAHKYPLGVTMSSERRVALAEWATRNDGWIIEDDYDGEFRYDRHPIGSLQGLAPDRVIYAGTASKSLAPGLRIGWLVVPRALRRDLATVKHLRGAVSALEQLTLADFVTRGALDRHLRSVRNLYRQRQDAIAAALASDVPALDVEVRPAGLHMTCFLPAGTDEAFLVQEAAEAGIGLMGLARHFMVPPERPGLVIGYSRPPEHHFPTALNELVRFLKRAI